MTQTTPMADDLQLRTARALRWVPTEHEDKVLPYADAEVWERDGKRAHVVIMQDGRACIYGDMPDWPTDLGACQEVLDAIKGRKWHYQMEGFEEAVLFNIYDNKSGALVAASDEAVESAAVCEAFCQAVEAGRKEESEDD